MNEWLTVYGWTVAVAMFCFADKSDDRPGRVASVVMSLFWPVTLLAIVAVTAKPFAVNVYWALRQGALIRRSANSLTRVITHRDDEEWQKLKRRRAALRIWLEHAEGNWMLRGGKWHRWLREEDAKAADAARAELLNSMGGGES